MDDDERFVVATRFGGTSLTPVPNKPEKLNNRRNTISLLDEERKHDKYYCLFVCFSYNSVICVVPSLKSFCIAPA